MQVTICPDTQICTIVRGDKTQLDLMPCEMSDVQLASSREAMREAISEADPKFAKALSDAELDELKILLK